ncbi:LLM class flavin-dependent oxidoreductase [Streptomyces sp. NPDC007983]|uniref:LLM class flavin-dependent oxidoreductase n=1 Tax=Streptomyces sp. NPDC007983 TaxID=3364800 RepID=UPI0036E32991
MTHAPAPRLSVLDVAPVWTGATGVDALQHAVDLAQHVERLGFLRYWVAEHHNTPSLATSAPAVLAGQLAAVTSTLRVGSGGVLLPNHAPLAVAEQFGTLEALHPGRIDLGIGRAGGSDPKTAQALRQSPGHDFPDQLQELLGYLGTDASTASSRTTVALPAPPGSPWVCLLGSSLSSAESAGRLGLPYAFAHHLMPQLTPSAVAAYRAAFRPSAALERPYVIVAAMVIVGESDEHAEELARPYLLRKIRIQHGDLYGLYPAAAEAAAHTFTTAERAFAVEHSAAQLFGGPETLRGKLTTLYTQTEADELMGITLVPDHADRIRSYELLSKVSGELGNGARATPRP